MSKGNLFVVIYSIILLALFATFCYLITTVKPLSKPDSTLKFGPEDLLFRNEVLLSKDIVRYGLERVSDEYENVDLNHNLQDTLATQSQLIAKATKEIKYGVNTGLPQYITNKEFNANCSNRKVNFLNIVTQSKKPVKDFRRSINDENQKNFIEEAPRSILLKIKDIDGEPRIEIELMSEQLKNKRTRKYRSSGGKIKKKLNSFDNINNIGNENIKEEFIEMGEKETLILNIFANSVDIIKENENATIEAYLFENSTENDFDSYTSETISTTTKNLSKKYFNMHTSLSDLNNREIDKMFQNGSTPMYMFNLLKTMNSSKVFNYTVNKESIDTGRSKDDVTSNSVQNFSNTHLIFNRSQSIDKIISSIPKLRERSGVRNETVTDVNMGTYTDVSSSLLDLLIPKVTTSVPVNYHFVN